MRTDHTSKWRRPYAVEEHEARVICLDPVAVAYDALETWLREQKFKYPITIEDAIDCLWSQVYGDQMTRYEIMRNDRVFPECVPDDLYKKLTLGLFGKE